MPFDPDHLQKRFAKLQKIAKPSSKLADPDRVHKLRTNTRRIEAILGALELSTAHRRKSLLQHLKKLRRIAGQVRDMDVLTSKAADVSVSDERSCQVRLLEHLGHQRHRQSKRLKSQLRNSEKPVRSALRDISAELQRATAAHNPASDAMEAQAVRSGVEHTKQLQRFATLTRRNLHQFRKSGKQLRYLLQMTTPRDQSFVDALSEMQTAIGEWHDWQELLAIAKDVLTHGANCGLLRELQLHADESFDRALKSATTVRRRLQKGTVTPLHVVPRAA
jgi:CHAD domain-containing protein